MILLTIPTALLILFLRDNRRYFSSLNRALEMTTIDKKTTIESLFRKGEIELEFWDLRERAQEAGISVLGLWEILNAERKANCIELLPNNNIKLIQTQRYETQITEGVKCPNMLCEQVKSDMFLLLETVNTTADDIETWQKRLNDSIAANAQLHSKCGLPHVIKWDNRQGKYFVTAYASQIAYVRGGAFITISVTPLED